MKRDAICQSAALILRPTRMLFECRSISISNHLSRRYEKPKSPSNFLECARTLSNKLGERFVRKPPPASTRNPAFQSKLEPYREFIRECRAKRWSYPRIAAALREEHDLSVAPSTIFSFVKVRAKRRRLYALPPSDEPRIVQPVPVTSRAREFFSPPDPKPDENKRRPYNI
jgi:hypothetical protein